MSKKRILACVAALVVASGALVGAMQLSSASAADCVASYNNDKVYLHGDRASADGYNWTAKWWSQHEKPSTGGSGVWERNDSCGGGGNQPPPPPNPGPSCSYPDWQPQHNYAAGSIVRYPANGNYYKASHENPGYDPTISTWFWDQFSCSGGNNPPPPPPGNPPPGGGNGFVVSEAQFNQMFPGRGGFYTYAGLVDAMKKYPAFTGTGSDTVKKQEAAAFLANVGHETGGLVYVDEINQANWPTYCDRSQPYGCPAGQSAYHGRGPIQLSWNFNYKAAGDALGIDLLNHPDLVSTDPSISWQTGIWYWMTGTGSAGTTSHGAMVNGNGFGTTIRAINGIECNGGHPDQMNHRVQLYQSFSQILGVSPGGNLTC
jgi:predicted chitinase/chitodextrinase